MASLSKVLCKFFRFLVKAATAIVDGITQVVRPLVDAAFSILGDLLDGLGGLATSLLKNPLVLIALGLGAWWLLGGKKDEEDEQRELLIRAQAESQRPQETL